MRVWVDDRRPMPQGYTHHAFTAGQAMALLDTGEVEEISLDHDLGNSKKDGNTVACYIEYLAYSGVLRPITVHIHTDNPAGRKEIENSLTSALGYWERLSLTPVERERLRKGWKPRG